MILLERRHIRTRLTLYFVAALGGILSVYIAAACFLQLRDLRAQAVWHAIQDLETVEGLLYFDMAGHLRLKEDYHNHPESRQVLERLLEVRDLDGRVLLRNQLLGNRSLGEQMLPREGEGGYSQREFSLADGTTVNLVSRKHSVEGRPTLIRVAYDQDPLWRQFRSDLIALALPLPLVLLLAATGGYRLASRLLQPVQALARQAAGISSERLSERLPVNPKDGELAELALAFNAVLGQLEESFEKLRRFTSDASHELRTPLAAIRSIGEVAMQANDTAAGYRDVIGSMLEEVNRLTRLVDSLLTIARADSGQIPIHRTDFVLAQLAEECAGLFQVLLEEKSLTLTMTAENRSDTLVRADRVLLRQCVLNVLHNAIKFTPPGGRIRLRVSREQDMVLLEVADEGPGVPDDKLDRIFDRFYRVDEGRSREVGGAGLGLAIAKWTVGIHGGTISAANNQDCGCVVRIRVPARTAPVLSSHSAARHELI